MIETLQKIGLNENEARVYLALLELGESTVLPISKKSEIHRTYCYDILDLLSKRGLVSYIEKNGRRRYIASDPTNIRSQIRENEKQFDLVLPDLVNLYLKPSGRLNMRFFEGIKGVETVYKEATREAKELWFIGSAGAWMKNFPNYEDFAKTQVRKKIKIRDLTTRDSGIESYAKYYKYPLQELRFLSKDIKLTTDNIIWGNKVALVSFSDVPHVALIESEEIVKTFKEMFEVLWQMSSKKENKIINPTVKVGFELDKID